MAKSKTLSYIDLINKFQIVIDSIIQEEESEEIFKRCMFGDLNGKTIKLKNGKVCFIDPNKRKSVYVIFEEIFECREFIINNYSTEKFEEKISAFIKEILEGKGLTKSNVKDFLDSFNVEIKNFSYLQPVFGINIARKNYKPFSIANFDFYKLPEGINYLQEKFEISNMDIDAMQKYTDEEYILKNMQGFDEKKVVELIKEEIELFVSAIQFTSDEIQETNVNLLNNTNKDYNHFFTFQDFKSFSSTMKLNSRTYSNCVIREELKIKHSNLWAIFEKEPYIRFELEQCLLRAIQWIAKSTVETNSQIGITECFIALETLFNGNLPKNKITSTLCCLAEKCVKDKYNFNIKEIIKDCYDQRSQIVHGEYYKDQENLHRFIIIIAKDVIFYLLDNYKQIDIKTNKEFLAWVNKK